MHIMTEKNAKPRQAKKMLAGRVQPGKNRAIEQVIADMEVRLDELESIREGIRKDGSRSISPQKSVQMLEEIIIPNIELIHYDKKVAAAKSH